MGVLAFTGSGSGFSANVGNVASLASAVGIKIRFKIDPLKTGSGFTGPGFVVADSDGAGTNIKFDLYGECNSSSQFLISMVADGVHQLVGPNVAQSSLPATGTFLVLYADFKAGGSGAMSINLTDDAGTNYYTASASGSYGNMNTTGSNGRVTVNNDVRNSHQVATTYDGVAIYNTTLVGAAQYAAPQPGDAGIVAAWVFDDVGTPSTAQAFVGGQGLVLTASQYTWQAGGIWTPVINKPPTQPKVASFAAINRSFSW